MFHIGLLFHEALSEREIVTDLSNRYHYLAG